MINIPDVDKYPADYSWLDEEVQAKILGYLNGTQSLANRYYNTYNNSEDKEEQEEYFHLYQVTLSNLAGAKSAYRTVEINGNHIMIEYDWKGHSKQWFLATRTDAENYDPDYNEEEEMIEQISKLLSYEEIL